MTKAPESNVSGGHINGSNSTRQMYPATCSQCGKPCEVPFVPNPNKPTYCKECFDKRKLAAKAQVVAKQHTNKPISARGGSSSGGQNTPGSGDIKQQLSAINSKLDRLIQVLGSKESSPARIGEASAPVKKSAKKTATKKKAAPKKK